MEPQHIVNMLDGEHAAVAPTMGLWGLIVFGVAIVAVCAYLAWKLPRRGDHDKE